MDAAFVVGAKVKELTIVKNQPTRPDARLDERGIKFRIAERRIAWPFYPGLLRLQAHNFPCLSHDRSDEDTGVIRDSPQSVSMSSQQSVPPWKKSPGFAACHSPARVQRIPSRRGDCSAIIVSSKEVVDKSVTLRWWTKRVIKATSSNPPIWSAWRWVIRMWLHLSGKTHIFEAQGDWNTHSRAAFSHRRIRSTDYSSHCVLKCRANS